MDKEGFWKLKLMAFLHDPPCKCFDIGLHEKIAESFRREAGLSEEEMEDFRKEADWFASAADRYPFPKKCASKFTGDSEYPFKHPLGGSSLSFSNPMETASLAEESFQKSSGGIPSDLDDWKTKFFLYWRRWPEESAKQDPRLAHLPADTRIPDHTIWTHMSLCSALQGCVNSGKLEPAFLIFQLGPVQEFISQARSTRDLWSGSYLLSWLMAHAIKAVTDEIGPDALIYPSLRGQPIYDLLHKDLFDQIQLTGESGEDETLWDRIYKHEINEGVRKLLTPTIPNRFCALVPAEKASVLAQKAKSAIKDELKDIGANIWNHLRQKNMLGTDIDHERWNKQLDMFPQITWQTLAWEEQVDTEGDLNKLEKTAMELIPEEDRDKRNYKDGKLNPGFFWSAQYEAANKAFAGRRNTRNFEQFLTDAHQDGSVKDPLSGKEEQIGATGASAITNIKREFAWQYLQPRIGFTEGQFNYSLRFDSTRDLSQKNRQRGE